MDADQPEQPWIDISTPLQAGMITWPGDPEFAIQRVTSLDDGDACTVSRVSLGVHAGTHVDAPAHYLKGGATIDAMPLGALIGRARVIAIENVAAITRADLEMHRPRAGERLLIKTQNSAALGTARKFAEDYAHLTREAAEYLVACDVSALGVDYLSVGAPDEDGDTVHRVLLGAGIWLIEGLRLVGVEPGEYDLACLPLAIAGAEAAPARAALRSRSKG